MSDQAYRANTDRPDGSTVSQTEPRRTICVAITALCGPLSLSGAAMQVLTIVAYRQPVSQASIESVRGTSSDSAMAHCRGIWLTCLRSQSWRPSNRWVQWRPVNAGL